jgi:hypothetical protein
MSGNVQNAAPLGATGVSPVRSRVPLSGMRDKRWVSRKRIPSFSPEGPPRRHSRSAREEIQLRRRENNPYHLRLRTPPFVAAA